MYPRQRTAGLVVSEVGLDLVVFDEQNSHLHTIPDPIASVWRACDGTCDARGIAETTSLTLDQVHAAIDQLHDVALLEAGHDGPATTPRKRRALLKQAVIGVSILSVSAPLAVQAQSAGQITCAMTPSLHLQALCMGSNPEATFDCQAVGCPANSVTVNRYVSGLQNAGGTILYHTYNYECRDGSGDVTTTPWSPYDASAFPPCVD